MNFICPNCEMENAYFALLDTKGAHYTCPDCDYEWVDRSVTTEDEEELEETDDEEEEDDVLAQARVFTYSAIGEFLSELIKIFDRYKFSEEDLIVLSKIYMLVRKPKKYSVNGYFSLMVKEVFTEGNHVFQEIKIDDDGLQLTSGGYETGQHGGDSFSEAIFPIYDEMEAMDIMTQIENFIDDFRDKLANPDTEVEIFDSGDDIDVIE